MCCNNKSENTNCEPKKTCERSCGSNNGFVIIIVLYILLAIILGSYAF